jgi:CheY-like chemotaxis protein
VRTGVRDEVPAVQREAMGSASALGLGRHAFLEVEDSGRVLDETFLRHIFDPFFAARVSSRGIALAIAQRVVERQRGAIYAWSAPERGTTFVVLLPEVQPAPVREVAFVPHARRAGRVLVVDDDPGVLEVTCAMLASRGWAVQRAATATEGLASLRNGLPDVVLLDLTLPRSGSLGDRDLAEVVRAEFPDLSIVLMSGLSTARSEGELGCADGFVPKPFSGAELHGALERALARRPSRQPQPAG